MGFSKTRSPSPCPVRLHLAQLNWYITEHKIFRELVLVEWEERRQPLTRLENDFEVGENGEWFRIHLETNLAVHSPCLSLWSLLVLLPQSVNAFNSLNISTQTFPSTKNSDISTSFFSWKYCRELRVNYFSWFYNVNSMLSFTRF